MEDLYWLEGTWRVLDAEPPAYEIWEKDGSQLRGKGLKRINGEDEVFEYLRIEKNDDGVFYIADVSHNDDEVAFQLIPSGIDTFHFSNPEHDFPTDITYIKQGSDSILVTVAGTDGKGFELRMIRQ